MTESSKLFVFFKTLNKEQYFFGQDVVMQSDDFKPLLEIYDPWEWSEQHQAAPVDYLLGLGSNGHMSFPKLADTIWGVLEMCLKHPSAPPAQTWSSRLSCITERNHTFNVKKNASPFMREDVRLPWVHALAKGVLNTKIKQYAQLGGTVDQTFKGLSPLMFLYENSHVDDWFSVAALQKCDLTTGNLGQYVKIWSQLNYTNITSLGKFAETVREVRQKHSPLSQEDKVFEEWLEVISACSGFKNTSAKAKDPLLAKHLQDETRQKIMLDTLCSMIVNLNEGYYRIQSTEVGALKVIFKVWDTHVPKSSPWQNVWDGAATYYNGIDSSLATVASSDRFKNLHALDQYIKQTSDGLLDHHWRKILRGHRGTAEEIQSWAWGGDLPVHQPWEEIKNLNPDENISQYVVAMVGNAIRLQSFHDFLRHCSVDFIQSHLDVMRDDDVFSEIWCARVLEACQSCNSNQRYNGVIDLMESVATKHNVKRSLQQYSAVLEPAPSRRKM